MTGFAHREEDIRLRRMKLIPVIKYQLRHRAIHKTCALSSGSFARNLLWVYDLMINHILKDPCSS